MVHFTGLLENARHPCGGTLSLEPMSLDFCKNRVRAGIGGWPGTATGGQIHVVHISHTHPPKEIIQALRKYLLGKEKHARVDLHCTFCHVILCSRFSREKKKEQSSTKRMNKRMNAGARRIMIGQARVSSRFGRHPKSQEGFTKGHDL